MSSIGKLMKQAARMQQQMEQTQAALAARTVEATSGGGAVKVVAKCDGTLASIKIDPAAVKLLTLIPASNVAGSSLSRSVAGMRVPSASSTCQSFMNSSLRRCCSDVSAGKILGHLADDCMESVGTGVSIRLLRRL